MDALALRATAQDLAAAFARAALNVRHAFAIIVETEAELAAVFMTTHQDRISVEAGNHNGWDDFTKADRAIERMARTAWQLIADRLEIRRVMSVGDWDELQKRLREGTIEPINEETVFAFGLKYLRAIPDLFDKAVREVFAWLRPRRPKYKSNSVLEIGPKVVLTRIVKLNFQDHRRYHVEADEHIRLSSLERVFSVLDGQGAAMKHSTSPLHIAIEASVDGTALTPYFRAKMFRNGNLHVEFRRRDLLAKFNARAGGMNLRPKGPCALAP